MGRKGGDTRTKRSMAPRFWSIQRKNRQFTVTTSPGPHAKGGSYPLAVLVRDVLKLVKTYREASGVIRDGKILVDGVVRRTADFPVGLMDVVEIALLKKVFRMVPVKGSALAPVEIPESEKNLKLCKIKGVTIVRGGRIQYNLHDGRSILAGEEKGLKPGDALLIEVPSQKILKTVSFKEGMLALTVRGRRTGDMGRVKELKVGNFTRPKMVGLEIGGAVTELPADLIITIGEETPLVTVSGGV